MSKYYYDSQAFLDECARRAALQAPALSVSPAPVTPAEVIEIPPAPKEKRPLAA